MADNNKALFTPREEDVEKKPYAKPTLTCYGDIESLTAGAPGRLTTDQSSQTGDASPGR